MVKRYKTCDTGAVMHDSDDTAFSTVFRVATKDSKPESFGFTILQFCMHKIELIKENEALELC